MNDSSQSDLLKLRQDEEQAFRSQEFAGLSLALAGQAGLVPSGAERAGLYLRAAQAALRAGDDERGLELLAQVTGHPPWERLARLHRLEVHWRRGEWEAAVVVIDEELGGGSLWNARGLRLEKARLLAFRLGRVEEALSELAAVIEEDPSSREARWLRLVLALRAGDWEKVDAGYAEFETIAETDGDHDFSQAIILRRAQLQEFRFKNAEAAGALYQKIDQEQAPLLGLLPAFELAESAREFSAADAQLSAIISKLAEKNEPSPLSLRLEKALLRRDGLDDAEAAASELAALKNDFPEELPILLMAVELAVEQGDSRERTELAGKLMSRLADPREIGVLAADRTRVLVEDLEDYEAAAEAARQWMEARPEEASAPQWLFEALTRAGRHQEAVELLDRMLGATSDPRVRQGLLFIKAELATHQLSDQKAALEAYRAALEIPPSQFPILTAMARLYHQSRDWQNLSRILTAIMKMVQDPAVKKFHQHWLAVILLERLGQEDQAFALYGELVKSDPADLAALKNVARISRKKASWNNVAGAIARMIENARDPAVKAHHQSQLAWLYEMRLAQKDKALPLYQSAAEGGDPLGMESLRRVAYARGEFESYIGVMLGLSEREAQGSLKAARLARAAGAQEIIGELAEAWASYEKARVSLIDQPHLHLAMIDLAQLSAYWGRYLSLLEEFAQRLADPNRRALLWESAWARSELPSANGEIDAQAMHQSFMALAEAASGWQEALRGAYLAALWTQDHQSRADALARMLKQAGEDESLPLRLRLAYLLRDDLGAREESVAALRQALARDQKNAPLIRELQLMYEEVGQWGELIRMMLAEIPLRKEAPLLIEIYSRLAKLYEEKFKAADEAVKCHQTILRLEPARRESHEERVRLLELKSRWEDMVTALLEFEAVSPEPADKITLLVRAATVLDEKIADPDRAVELLKKALELDPSRDDLLGLLEKIFEREQRYQDLIEILLAQAERVSENEVKAVLHERAASLHENQLNDPQTAIGLLVAARDFDPARQSVLLTLERLFTGFERWEELIDTLERLASLADDAARIEYYSRIGTLWDEKLGKPPEAVASWERVRELDAANLPAHEALVALYERTGQDELFVERAAALAELVVEDKARSVELLVRAGSVLETRLQDDDRALGLYHRAMEVDEVALPPVRAARAINEKRENWPEVISLLLKEEGIVEAVEAKLELLTEAGRIYEQRVEDENSAAGVYERALALSGDYLPAIEPLSEIYYRREDFGKARPLFEIRTGALTGLEAPAVSEVWHKTGWCAEKLGETEAALERYRRSVEAVSDYRPPLERLSELYFNQEQWDPAAEFTARLLEVVRKAQDQEAAFLILHRLGRIEDKRDKLDQAVLAIEQALELKPNDYQTLTLLIDLYLRTRQWKKVLVTYDQAIKNSPSKAAAADGLVGKGKVLEDHIKEEKSALAHFTKAVEVVPEHLEGWERLAGIYYRNQSWPEAETALSRLLDLEKDSVKLLDHRHRLGRVFMDGMEDLDRAREQFEAALAINELHVPSMQSLLEIYLKQEEWDKFIATGERFVRLVPAEEQASLVPTYINLGRVYRDQSKNTERAVLNFQSAIRLNPDDQEPRAELAALYLSDPKFIDQAKTENRALIHKQPFRAQTYRDLVSIYRSQNNLDAVFYLSFLLSHFAELNYEEEMFFEANKAKLHARSQRTLKDLEREGQLVHPDERGPLRDMLMSMGESLTKLFPVNLDRMGAKKSTMLTDKTASPIKDLAIELAGNLGVSDLNIYLVPQVTEPQVAHTSPPSLIINAEWWKRFKEPEQRFLMARLLEHAIDNHSVVFLNPPEKVIQTMCLIAMTANPGLNIALPGLEPAEIEKQKKAMRKLITRKAKSLVEHAAERFTPDLIETDPVQWRKALEHTGNRAGLLLCPDISAAFGAVIKADPRYKSIKYEDLEDPKSVWEKHEDIIELLDFAVSDAHFRLRAQLGIAIA